jgi:hypothetical protein
MLEAKHVEVDFHFVRDTVNRISLISLSRFSFLGHKLTVDPLPLSLGGGVLENYLLITLPKLSFFIFVIEYLPKLSWIQMHVTSICCLSSSEDDQLN